MSEWQINRFAPAFLHVWQLLWFRLDMQGFSMRQGNCGSLTARELISLFSSAWRATKRDKWKDGEQRKINRHQARYFREEKLKDTRFSGDKFISTFDQAFSSSAAYFSVSRWRLRSFKSNDSNECHRWVIRSMVQAWSHHTILLRKHLFSSRRQTCAEPVHILPSVAFAHRLAHSQQLSIHMPPPVMCRRKPVRAPVGLRTWKNYETHGFSTLLWISGLAATWVSCMEYHHHVYILGVHLLHVHAYPHTNMNTWGTFKQHFCGLKCKNQVFP